jgi:hypothetical protein
MSNGPEFFQTGMGRTFYEGTMPKIAKALERLATVLENEGLTIEVLDLLRAHVRLADAIEPALREAASPAAMSVYGALLMRTRTLLTQLEAKK